MTRREIFFLVSLACLGVLILIGAYLWKENRAFSRDLDEVYTRQAEDLQKEEKDAKVSQAYPGKNMLTKPSLFAATPKVAPAPGTVGTGSAGPTQASPAPATPGNVHSPAPAPAPPAPPPAPPAPAKSSYIALGAKVGDIVKLGDVEMIVTKSTARHKVIDITLKGNDPDQAPRLILTDNNRIVYEIAADVDVNVDVTEKTTIDKSPIFYGEQKAGK